MAIMPKHMQARIKRELRKHVNHPQNCFCCPKCGRKAYSTMSHMKCMNCAPDMEKL